MTLFFQQLINGLNAGSIYALIALGYTMVYGIIKLINFAHGEVMMMGAYIAFYIAISLTGIPFPLIIIIAMILAAILGILLEKLAYKPLRKAPRLSLLITAIGVSLFLQNFANVVFGSEPKVMPKLITLPALIVGELTIPAITYITIILSTIMMIGLTLFVKHSKPGKAMRAVSEDRDASVLMGINVNRTISLTFAIGSSLGALGGILYSVAFTQVAPTMGTLPGLRAFVAAVLGGIGILPGAMLGGFIIGIAETFTKAYLSSAWADAIVYGILIIVLLVKPTGILGKNVKEKV